MESTIATGCTRSSQQLHYGRMRRVRFGTIEDIDHKDHTLCVSQLAQDSHFAGLLSWTTSVQDALSGIFEWRANVREEFLRARMLQIAKNS